jgi:hypothetical protein
VFVGKQHVSAQVVVFLTQGKYNHASREDREVMENLIQTNILVITPRRRYAYLPTYIELTVLQESCLLRGLYIAKYLPPPGGGYPPMSFGEKNMKSGREREGKCLRKRKKGERIREKGKEKRKINAK